MHLNPWTRRRDAAVVPLPADRPTAAELAYLRALEAEVGTLVWKWRQHRRRHYSHIALGALDAVGALWDAYHDEGGDRA